MTCPPQHGSDQQPPASYFAEHRRHLGVIHVVLAGAAPTDTGRLLVEVDARDATVVRIDRGRLVLRLPVEAAGGQRLDLAIDSGSDEVAFQLRPAEHVVEHPPPTTTVRPPLSAQELTALGPTSLFCSSCSNPLARLDALTWRNLPSAHWREIADAWLCHPKGGNDFTQRYARKMEEGIWPERGVGLVGLWEMLLDGGAVKGLLDLQAGAATELQEDWQPAVCPCGAVVGSHCAHLAEGSDGKSGRAIKLLKHLVAVKIAGAPTISYRPERFIVSEMLEIFQTHSTPRFWVTSEDDESCGLLVWLFTPDAEVSFGVLESEDAPGAASTGRHCRLLYLTSSSDSAPARGPKNQPLTYAAPIFSALLAALDQSTAALPPSQRAFGQHQVAILPRS